MEAVEVAREAAFERFAEGQAAALALLAYQLTGHREAARDLVQDVLLEVFRQWPKVSTAGSRAAYVRRILVNRHLSGVRRPRVREILSADHVDLDAMAPQGLSYDHVHADHDAMWKALAALPDRQRTVLVLRYYEGLPDADIAGIVGCRRTTVRSLAARGRSALRTDPQLAQLVASDSRSVR